MLNCITNTVNVHQLLSTSLDLMARRVLPGPNVAFGLSLFLFTFMFLPTLVMLLAVIVFFAFYYPRLRKLTAVHNDDYDDFPQLGDPVRSQSQPPGHLPDQLHHQNKLLATSSRDDLVEIPAESSKEQTVTIPWIPLEEGHEYTVEAKGIWHGIWACTRDEVTNLQLESLGEGEARGKFESERVVFKVTR
ncbi:uncharacterized protein Aud_002231 [Aspergillus udagawae]|uniref:Uncharacterized protein n=1 Tax=Aspergillus udagawae TaxID=91492 RepID=A0A8E0V5E2_9EURO|nr:uncharacterized protein Aud_002231 [Aspergillus udagawae]GIC94901.1 hypothetical protein Aud_002231 [Aspergillus udagawae]